MNDFFFLRFFLVSMRWDTQRWKDRDTKMYINRRRREALFIMATMKRACWLISILEILKTSQERESESDLPVLKRDKRLLSTVPTYSSYCCDNKWLGVGSLSKEKINTKTMWKYGWRLFQNHRSQLMLHIHLFLLRENRKEKTGPPWPQPNWLPPHSTG